MKKQIHHRGKIWEPLRRAFAEFLTVPTLVIAGFLLLAGASYALDHLEIPMLEPLRALLRGKIFRDAKATSDLLGTIAGEPQTHVHGRKYLAAIVAHSISVLIVASACISCQRQHTIVSSPPTPTPVPVLALAAPTPEKHLAPDGVFFLKERVSHTSSSGVITLVPGSQVRLVSRDGDRLRVTDGTIEIVVSALQLTNDIDEDQAIRRADAGQQAQVAAAIAEQQRTRTREKAEQVAAWRRDQRERPATAPPPPPPVRDNPLEKPAYNSTKARKYYDGKGRAYWIDIYGRHHYD